MAHRHRSRRRGWTAWAAPVAGVLAFCSLAGGALFWASDEPAERAGQRLGHATQQIAVKVASLQTEPLLGGNLVLAPAASEGGFTDPGQSASLELASTASADNARGAALPALGQQGAQPRVDENAEEAAQPSEAPPGIPPEEPPDAGPPPPPVAPEPAPEPPEEPPVESCGAVTCGSGEVCCNPSCGTCVPEGEKCDTTPCEPRIQVPRVPVSMPCGQNTCSVGEVCCNATCGTCVPAGQSCDETPCPTRIQTPIAALSTMCGHNTCNVGEVCCNETCGTCVAAGQSCDQTACVPRIR